MSRLPIRAVLEIKPILNLHMIDHYVMVYRATSSTPRALLAFTIHACRAGGYHRQRNRRPGNPSYEGRLQEMLELWLEENIRRCRRPHSMLEAPVYFSVFYLLRAYFVTSKAFKLFAEQQTIQTEREHAAAEKQNKSS
jgi:hypothetical protein